MGDQKNNMFDPNFNQFFSKWIIIKLQAPVQKLFFHEIEKKSYYSLPFCIFSNTITEFNMILF